MGEGDPQADSARLPERLLQETGDPVGIRRLSLLRYASSCPSTSRCKGSTALSRSSRSPRSEGNPRLRRPQGLRSLCMVRGEGEGMPSFSYPLQAILGTSQTAFCAGPKQA